MPFTFCHPAIILPLTKSKRLSTSALIIGSTAPDFEYFIRMDMIRTHSHDFWAIFYLNLPLTLVLFYIFQLIVKVPLINNLPYFLQGRFKQYKNNSIQWLSLKKNLWVIVSAIVGIFSHILWDSFTHKEGFFEGSSFLTETFILFGKEQIFFQFLQMWSSVFGGLYILLFILKMPTIKIIDFKPIIKFWLIAIGISILVIYFRNCDTSSKFIATSIAGGFIGLILTSALYKIKIGKLFT